MGGVEIGEDGSGRDGSGGDGRGEMVERIWG